jgi:hypothetical protein
MLLKCSNDVIVVVVRWQLILGVIYEDGGQTLTSSLMVFSLCRQVVDPNGAVMQG